jgi:hypothetical protein
MMPGQITELSLVLNPTATPSLRLGERCAQKCAVIVGAADHEKARRKCGSLALPNRYAETVPLPANVDPTSGMKISNLRDLLFSRPKTLEQKFLLEKSPKNGPGRGMKNRVA